MAYVKAECKRTGIKCDLRPTTWVKCDGVQCSGYFDETDRVLVVAMNKPDSLGVLVHEYCHLTQWEEGIDIWKKSDVSGVKLNEWLAGEKVRNIRKHIDVVRDMELDNEHRAVRMIKKWKLSINVEDYIRGANAYVHFYNWLYYTRKWSSPNNLPYNSEIVMGTMSTKFNMKYNEMPRRVLNAFIAAEIKHTHK